MGARGDEDELDDRVQGYRGGVDHQVVQARVGRVGAVEAADVGDAGLVGRAQAPVGLLENASERWADGTMFAIVASRITISWAYPTTSRIHQRRAGPAASPDERACSDTAIADSLIHAAYAFRGRCRRTAGYRRHGGRARARRGYGRRVILRIIRRNRPPECRCLRSFVTSHGIGGAVPSKDGRGLIMAGPGSG